MEGQRLPVVRGNGLKAKLFQGFASMMFWMKVGRFPQAGEVQWNFHKFVISREGGVKGHFASDCDPLDSEIITCIERELEE
jgi:glutathione peroxidase-family protein